MLAGAASATADYRDTVDAGASGTDLDDYLDHAAAQDNALARRGRFLAAGGVLGGLGVALGVAGAF